MTNISLKDHYKELINVNNTEAPNEVSDDDIGRINELRSKVYVILTKGKKYGVGVDENSDAGLMANRLVKNYMISLVDGKDTADRLSALKEINSNFDDAIAHNITENIPVNEEYKKRTIKNNTKKMMYISSITVLMLFMIYLILVNAYGTSEIFTNVSDSWHTQDN